MVLTGALSGRNLDTTLGSCQFDTEVTGRRFHGTLYKCQLVLGAQRLNYRRGSVQWGEDSYSTDKGCLHLPGTGSLLRGRGESTWQSGDRKILVEFGILLTLATDHTIEGSLEARIDLIVPLRQPK